MGCTVETVSVPSASTRVVTLFESAVCSIVSLFPLSSSTTVVFEPSGFVDTELVVLSASFSITYMEPSGWVVVKACSPFSLVTLSVEVPLVKILDSVSEPSLAFT